MLMEKPPSFESKESVIDGLIEQLAQREGMSVEDISSDILTFFELSQADEDAKAYLEEVAEKIGISIDELMTYAAQKQADLL